MKYLLFLPFLILFLFNSCQTCSDVAPSDRLYFLGYNDSQIMIKLQSNRGVCEGPLEEDEDNYSDKTLIINRLDGTIERDDDTSDSKAKTYSVSGYNTIFNNSFELASDHFDSISFITNQEEQRFTIKRGRNQSQYQLIVEKIIKESVDGKEMITYELLETYEF